MLIGNRKSSGTTVAVEIAAHALRVLTVRTEKGKPVVERYESIAIPGEDQAGRHESVARNLASLPEAAGGRNAEIRVVVDMPTLLFRNLDFPPMPASEIAGAVKYQWAELTETPIERMACDAALNRPAAAARQDRTEILLAAVPRTDLETLLAPFREAGLAPPVALPAAAALHALRAFETGRAGASEEPEVIVDIGETRTAVALVQGPHFFMAREITTGGGAFSRILQRELGVEPEEAEKLKCLYGIPDPDARASTDVDESTARSILFALRPVAERLVGEIERTVAHAREHHGAGPIGRVLLVGGGSRLRGLDQMIARAMEAPAARWRPDVDALAVVPADGAGRDSEISAVCLGAAVKPPALNLLSPSALLRPRGRPGARTLGAVAACVLALAAGAGWHVWKARQVAEVLVEREARLAAFVAAGGGMGALHPYLAARGRDEIDFTATFLELDRLAPAGVVIDSLALSRPREGEGPGQPGRILRLGGVAGGATNFAEANLARFLDSLEESPGFRNIQLVRSAGLGRHEGSGLRFGFTCEIAPAHPDAGAEGGEGP